jgi:hypothetical protein
MSWGREKLLSLYISLVAFTAPIVHHFPLILPLPLLAVLRHHYVFG